MPTARELLTRSLKLIGVVSAKQPVSAEDLADGLDDLNDWVTWLETQRASIFEVRRAPFPLTANKAEYTIGPSGDWSSVLRPLFIERASVVTDRNAVHVQEIPIGRPLNVEEWQRIPIKTTTSSWPNRFWYDYGFETLGVGKISVFPIPDNGACDLVLYLPIAMQQFADLDTDYNLPPAYARTIRYNMALELAPSYDAQPSPLVIEIANESLASVKRANFRPREMGFDPALVGYRGRTYDIWSDTD
jgi:hypothetical protein